MIRRICASLIGFETNSANLATCARTFQRIQLVNPLISGGFLVVKLSAKGGSPSRDMLEFPHTSHERANHELRYSDTQIPPCGAYSRRAERQTQRAFHTRNGRACERHAKRIARHSFQNYEAGGHQQDSLITFRADFIARAAILAILVKLFLDREGCCRIASRTTSATHDNVSREKSLSWQSFFFIGVPLWWVVMVRRLSRQAQAGIHLGEGPGVDRREAQELHRPTDK